MLFRSGGACRVQTSTAVFDVFPKNADTTKWSLLSNPSESLESKQVISWPGEYDFSGVTLRAIGQEAGKQVSYSAHNDGIRMGFVNTPILAWSDADLERLGDVDVLVVVPDDTKRLTALIEAIDPRVILLCGGTPSDALGAAKVFGQSPAPVSEFKVKPGTLPQDGRQVVILQN